MRGEVWQSPEADAVPVPRTVLGKVHLWEADIRCLGSTGKLGEAHWVTTLETVGVFSLPGFEGWGWLPGPDCGAHMCARAGSHLCWPEHHHSLYLTGVQYWIVLGFLEDLFLGCLGCSLTSWEAEQREICRLRFPLEKVTQTTDVFQMRDLPKLKPGPWFTLSLKPSLTTAAPSA